MLCDQPEVEDKVSEIDKELVSLVYIATGTTRGDVVHILEQVKYIYDDESLIITWLLHTIRSD